ncbi:uncharacterized protein CCOS01_14697 [Colletotrichum costaricense]|uniref:Uncharacterized protein n=1 Tax=Colletotrichum costaricense TaxID=1209916 RepID=A0AAI9YJ41_9PEZI|nr:uncharacterized protein CCOS01_14697 [Colletotrichum costaricense]KAK1512457.1 hypothetical protein CCOS01_14697 [Colletotrichum costaricense]
MHRLGGVAPAPILPKRHAQASQAGGSTAGQCALERWALGRVSRSSPGPRSSPPSPIRTFSPSLLSPRLPRPSPFLSRRLSQFPLVTGSKSSPSCNCPVFSRPFLGFYSLFCRRCCPEPRRPVHFFFVQNSRCRIHQVP